MSADHPLENGRPGEHRQQQRRQFQRRQQDQGPPPGQPERRRTERRQSPERRLSLQHQAQGYVPGAGTCPQCRDMQSHLKDFCSRCGTELPWADQEIEIEDKPSLSTKLKQVLLPFKGNSR